MPLGRLVEHDPASVAYALPALPYRVLKTIRWQRRTPILDQSDLHAQGIHAPGDPDSLGSCVGNAAAGLLGTDPYATSLTGVQVADLTESYAVQLYSDATRADTYAGSWPPDDTGTSGLAVCKVMRRRGLIGSYHHAFGLRACVTALQDGPVLVGIPWYEGMFHADAAGRVTISGDVAGGHELCAVGVDMAVREVLLANSWTTGWGDGGYLRLTFDQLDALLSQDGDVTVPARPS